MPKIKINNQYIEIAGKTTVLEAARSIGLEIPTLCYLSGYDFFTSCMICVVLDQKSNKLIPACSIAVEEGMEIDTECERVKTARKDTMDMLLSEHVGDCEATCTRGCPSNMNIPKMIRHIQNAQFEEAIKTIKEDIPLPAVLGRTCSSPCENACIHRMYDTSISICQLERIVADIDLASDTPYLPEIKELTHRKVAVIGAGPTGLSAAYYSRRDGHEVTLYDKNTEPGGMMKYGIPAERLDKSVLDKEIVQIMGIGIEYKGRRELGKNLGFNELVATYDAVILAVGTLDPKSMRLSGLVLSDRGITVNKNSLQTKIDRVFAGGNAIRKGRSIIRSCSHGKRMAYSVTEFLRKGATKGPTVRFNSVIGKIRPTELAEFIKSSQPHERAVPVGENNPGLTQEESICESERCFHCDCRKKEHCKLRDYADEFKGNQKRYKIADRNEFKRVIQHSEVIFEPGKCIKCNLCVQITEKAGEAIGLTMVNRGFDITIATPFNETLGAGLSKVANEVVHACPTAALSFIDDSGRYEK